MLTNQQSLLVVEDGAVRTGGPDSAVAREVGELKTVDRVLGQLR